MTRILLLLTTLLACQLAQAAVILQYHHVSDHAPKSTTTSIDRFNEHMAYIKEHEFNVIPMSKLVEMLNKGQEPAPKTVVITFDDGYQDNFDNAHPILKQYGFPYTVFVATDPLDKGFHQMMSWETIGKMVADGVEIANHTSSHLHLVQKLEGENNSQWLARIQKDIENAEAKIKQNTGYNFKMLAYPYGEYDDQVTALLEQLGYIGIGQQSGAVGLTTDLRAIPRFPMANTYSSMPSFKVKINSMPFTLLEVTPTDPTLAHDNTRPELRVKMDVTDVRTKELMCYVQGQGAVKPVWVSDNEFVISPEGDVPVGRSRYNCTAPSKTKSGYFWFSQPWLRAKADGTYPKG
ncbi:polysaccharide deacetylase family protein [Paraferrimonas haliotis]|uniref:Polysaccharide deacetylase n=1 Tax=Paraferrimonas haliotis TaxID=2013866 RepID=A0AA37WXG2_9GAMM|nr:polysaccharide deacetylase family protein [Paraferrimonas haliotis]GLS83494.1 polysaccharide deacetylase [Paraferrimonas haliotis]